MAAVRSSSSSSSTIFLEEWLRTSSSSSNSPPSPSPSTGRARVIIQSWSDLRDSLEHKIFQPRHFLSLQNLIDSKTSIHVADPQAHLLLSLLSSSPPPPPPSYPLFLRLLYFWIRKSSRPSPSLIDTALDLFSNNIFRDFVFTDPHLFSQSLLLLGAFSFVPSLSDSSKTVSLDLICRLLESQKNSTRLLSSVEEHALVPDVLAGIGYALSSSISSHSVRILDWLFGIWDKEDGFSVSVTHGLMILHLIEWIVTGLIKSFANEKLQFFCFEGLDSSKGDTSGVLFSILMASAGVLRALAGSLVSSRIDSQIIFRLRNCSEDRIESVAQYLISRIGMNSDLECDSNSSLLLRCFALALARAGSVSPRVPLFLSLSMALLMEVYPLRKLYAKIRGSVDSDLGSEIREHVNSVLLKEAGAISGVLCNYYVTMDKESRAVVESMMWRFCQELYSGHRRVAMELCGKDDKLLSDIEKIAESAFLMVVVFSLAVTKHKLNLEQLKSRMETSVSILIAFSCLEYFRRLRLPEYMDTIRGVVVSVQENEAACVLFIQSMPSYVDMTKPQEFMQKLEYSWFKDDVQTARVMFYLRVIPTLIERMPCPLFSRVIAPTMFLYMDHQNSKVARASHSLFVAFLSSGNTSNENEGVLLKEQLAFHYIQKSLEGYPGVTPFEGMASGIAALVRYLPAGSPAIFYCIQSLVEKGKRLCSDIPTQEADRWKSWQDESEPSKKLLELLLRLVSLVDVQVLPCLMKLLAQLIVQLPKDGQNKVLDALYMQIAESDDLTRKPALVSWLQSVSYLCSEAQSGEMVSRNTKGSEIANPPPTEPSNWDRINARM